MNKQLLIEALDNKKDVIFFFNSNSCGACSEVKSLIEQFAKTKNKSVYMNVTEGDPDSEYLEKFCNVEFYPTLILLESSGTLKRYVGKNQIKSNI
jgi:thiol-disulfide isomerase/thioredoxin